MDQSKVLGKVAGKDITADMVDGIMVGAFEGSINYWCENAKGIDLPARKDRTASCFGGERTTAEMLSQGFALILDDGDNKHILTLDNFLKGCEQHANVTGEFDDEQMDATDYDNIIQYALFGKLVFG